MTDILTTTSQTLHQTTTTITDTLPTEYPLYQKRTRMLSNSVDETQDTDNNTRDPIYENSINISTAVTQMITPEQVPNENSQETGELRIQIQENNNNSQQNSEAASMENQQNQTELQRILKKSAEFRFRRAFFICMAMFLGLFSLQSAMEGNLDSLNELYIVSCSFFGYYLIENIILTVSKDVLPWKRTENLFDTLDIAILIVFIASAALKTNGMDFPVKTICVLPTVNLMAYFWKSCAPKSQKQALLVIRAFYSLQIFLLSEKVDGDLFFSWPAILCIFWIFLGSLALYFILFTGILIYAIIAGLLKRTMPFDMDRRAQIKGLLWTTIYSSLSAVAFIGFVAEMKKDRELLKLCFNAAKLLSIFAGMFPLATYSSIIEFLRKSDIEEHVYKEHLGLLASSEEDRDGVSVERKNVFLVRLSSTYFSLLNEAFFARNKKELKTVRRSGSRHSKDKPINNNKFCFTQREMTVIHSPNNVNAADKVCLTECESKYKKEDSQNVQEEEQQQCYICYSNAPNAVIVECGHGGVCSECAVEIIKRKGLCMQCRKQARKVVKIDPNFAGTNIIKGYETITVKEVHIVTN